MSRVATLLISLAAFLGAAAVSTSAAATDAAPTGKLTSAEYRQLSSATSALDRSASAKSVNWTRARAACRRAGAATELLRTQRASCLESLKLFEALGRFPAEERHCVAISKRKGTTNATAATSPVDSAVVRQLVCMSPRYRALSGDAKATYKTDIAARKEAVRRGFRGSCLATLATSPSQLRKERSFAASAQQLATDVTLLIKVTEGKAPSRDFNQSKIDRHAKQFEASAAAVLAERSPQKLSSCAHQ